MYFFQRRILYSEKNDFFQEFSQGKKQFQEEIQNFFFLLAEFLFSGESFL